jgi:hypothetical protein
MFCFYIVENTLLPSTRFPNDGQPNVIDDCDGRNNKKNISHLPREACPIRVCAKINIVDDKG